MTAGSPPVLAGRAAQRSQFFRAVARAASGAPRALIIDGEPGMGKTALLDELLGDTRPSWHVIRTTCDRFEAEIGFAVAGLLIGEWLDAATSPIAVGRRLLDWFGQLQQQDGVAVVAVDDAQWMDQASADALRFAIRRLRADRVLVVLCRRPPLDDDPWQQLLADPNLTTHLTLTPLSVADVRDYLGSAAPGSGEAADAERLVVESGGLPLLVAALLAGAGHLETDPRPGADPIAQATRQLLRHVGPDARNLVEALAVVAQPAGVITLGQVADVAEPTAALAELLATPVVRHTVEPGRGDTGLVEFSHALFQGAVYQRIPADRRQRWHVRAAEVTTGENRLRHRVAAADHADDVLAAELESAALMRANTEDHKRAAALFADARRVTADPVDADRLLAMAIVQLVEARAVREATQLQGDLDRSIDSCERRLATGMLLRESGQPGPAMTELAAAVDMAEESGRGDVAETASMELAMTHLILTDGAGAAAAAARAIASTDHGLSGQAAVVRAFGLWMDGQIDRARAELDRLAPAGATVVEASRRTARGIVEIYADDFDGALADLDASVQLSDTWRPSVFFDQAHLHRSLVQYELGDWDAAAVDAATAIALAEAGDRPWALPLAHATAVAVFAGRGQWEAARFHLDRAGRALAAAPSFQGSGVVGQATIYLLLAQQEWAEAITVLGPFLERAIAGRLVELGAYRTPLLAQGEALARLGRLDEAAESISFFERAVAHNPGVRGDLGAKWLRGLVAHATGDAAAARSWFTAELSNEWVARAPLLHARVLHDFGRLELATGNRRDAIDRLRAARDVLLRLRAAPYLERCESDLAACGLRMHTGTGATTVLTPREQDVATLIARGLTNAEAAAELFVTAKTVDYHLGNIYAKLGIAGRRQLRGMFAAVNAAP